MDKEILYRFFEGMVSAEEGELVKAWVEAAPENEKAFFKERKIFDALLLLSHTRKEKKNNNYHTLYIGLLRIANILLLILTCGLGYLHFSKPDDMQAMQTIHSPRGQRVNVVLPDGTNVWLNSGTTIQYPLVFNRKERRVELNGEAYFDVAKNPEKPFVVQTNKYDVQVLGTKFNVVSYTDNNDFETTLMEGRVELISADDPEQIFRMQPNTKAYLENGRLKVAKVDDMEPYRWKEGLICFKNKTFASIMKDFEKYYGLKIQVNNKEIQKYFYTGKFRQTDGIDYALRVLQKDIKFTYQRDDDNQIIYIE